MGMTVEAVEDSRYETSRDEKDNAHIVQLVAKLGNNGRVIVDRVVGGRHSQAKSGSCEEAAQCDKIRGSS